MIPRFLTATVVSVLCACGGVTRAANVPPHTLWLEAETFGPLRGGNFS